MTRTWLSLTVELLGGRAEELWPWPGRIFAVGPSHRPEDIRDALNAGASTVVVGKAVTDAYALTHDLVVAANTTERPEPVR